MGTTRIDPRLTDRERRERVRVESAARPLTMLALMYLWANPDPTYSWGGPRSAWIGKAP